MELVRIKALTPISHGYLDESGNVVSVDLNVDEVGEVPAADAKKLHEAGLVKVAASQAATVEQASEEVESKPEPQQPVNGNDQDSSEV